MTSRRELEGTRSAVAVLGDIGRSPRMRYHALALAQAGSTVDLVGYAGTSPGRELAQHPSIRLHSIALAPPSAEASSIRSAWRLVAAGARVADTLRRLPRPDVLLVQNPPALPTLPLALALARLRRTRFVIDWHNPGHAMVALRLGPRHPAVGAVRACEQRLGRMADAHLCVSQALQQHLRDRDIAAAVLYDRPWPTFVQRSEAEREQITTDLRRRRPALFEGLDPRPFLVVSPTSWTADEDFDLLLAAARRLESHEGSLPPLLFLLTGDGPRRQLFEERVAGEGLRRSRIRTAWLDADEYPLVLAAADVGVSLHRSASGLDLPMKIADLCGSGVPVCALDYGVCLDERFEDRRHGLLFRTADELAEALVRLVRDGTEWRRRLAASKPTDWVAGWRREALPLFSALLRRG